MLCTWRRKAWNFSVDREMDPNHNSLVYVNSPHDHFSNYNDADSSEPSETRPSILITFQNSASYYTSYMGSGGTRGGGGGSSCSRRQCSDVQIQPPPQQQQQQQKEHPIVIMKEYPSPAPVSVAVSSRKQGCDPVFKAFSGPPMPQGPPKPPGPPLPNIPPMSRRESINTTLELPKSRRSSVSPSIASSRNRSPSTQSRVLLPNNVPPNRPHGGAGRFESTTLPRKMKAHLPRNSQSMPTLSGDLEIENLEPLTPSPRPSLCSSAAAHSQGERRPLMRERRLSQDMEDWTPPTQPKPNWLSLNPNNERKDSRTQSVYVAEIWPSLVCILTAVLLTLIVYILVSYFYSVPHPITRNRIAPTFNRPTSYPPPPTPYPYPYPPYVPPPYDRYSPYYPPHPSPSNP